MKKKDQFIPSHDIMEIEEFNATQAKLLVIKLSAEETGPAMIALDCVPNGNLGAFNYANGLKEARIIYQLANSLLGSERAWLASKIGASQDSKLKTNFVVGEKAGLWKKILPEERTEIDWTKPFCVKNEQGLTKIWHPNWQRLGYKNGFSTKASIISFIHESPSYRQKFFPPLKNPINFLRMHYRLVFFVNPKNKECEFIGGLWIARSSFKIYLNRDSIVGLVSPLTTASSFV